jgi:hypothetical protein
LRYDLRVFLPRSTADIHRQLHLLQRDQRVNPKVRPPRVKQTNLPLNAKEPPTNKEVAKILGDISNTRQRQQTTELSDRRKSAPARIDPTKENLKGHHNI